MLGAEFLAVIQVLVYAGGIVVLYLFVVMLVNLRAAPDGPAAPRGTRVSGLRSRRRARRRSQRSWSIPRRVRLPRPAAAPAASPAGNTEVVGMAALHRLPRAVRGGVDAAARRDGRGNHAGAEGHVTPITPYHYLVLSAALFTTGVVGVMLRRNIIVIFMSIELMLNAVNINLAAFSHQLHDASGQVFAVFVVAVAAAEAAVGLGIVLAFFRNKETLNVDDMDISQMVGATASSAPRRIEQMTPLSIIPAFPAAGAAVIGLLGVRWFSRKASAIVACSAIAASLFASLTAFCQTGRRATRPAKSSNSCSATGIT